MRVPTRSATAVVVAAALLALAGCMGPQGRAAGPGDGPGMMGQGPGMMGYGPGAMGGPGRGMTMGGAGMMMGGPGMMMGGGTMWGLERLDLSAEQRARIAQIQDEARRQQLAWMEAMHAQDGPMGRVMGSTSLDDAEARQAYAQMSALHQQMFDAHLQTRKRILEVLTPAQRAELERTWRGPGPR